MSSLIRGLVIAVVLATSLVPAACGSSSDDAPTKAQFIKQADAICKKAHDGFGKAFQQAFGSNPHPSQAQLNKFAESTLAPGVEGEIDDIRDLDPPSADQDQVDAILDAEQSGVDKIKANPAILSPSVKEDPLSKGQQLARAYGMKECST